MITSDGIKPFELRCTLYFLFMKFSYNSDSQVNGDMINLYYGGYMDIFMLPFKFSHEFLIFIGFSNI